MKASCAFQRRALHFLYSLFAHRSQARTPVRNSTDNLGQQWPVSCFFCKTILQCAKDSRIQFFRGMTASVSAALMSMTPLKILASSPRATSVATASTNTREEDKQMSTPTTNRLRETEMERKTRSVHTRERETTSEDGGLGRFCQNVASFRSREEKETFRLRLVHLTSVSLFVMDSKGFAQQRSASNRVLE